MIAQIVGWAYTTMSASSIIPRRNRSKDQKRLLGPFMYVYTFWVLATKRPWIAEEGCGGRHLAVIWAEKGGWRKFDKQTFSVFFSRQLRRTNANAAISHPSSVHHSPASLPLHLFVSSCDRITSTSPPPPPRPLPPLPSGDFRRPLKLIITPPPPPKAKSQKLEKDEEERPPFKNFPGFPGSSI